MDSARMAAAPVAIALVILVPVMVGNTMSEPEPVTSTLTISADASEEYIRILSDVEPEPLSQSTLVSRTGTNASTATVEAYGPGSASEGSCVDAQVRDTGTRPTSGGTSGLEWCLRISGIEAGSSVEGQIEGTGLTLTVNRAEPFFWLPFAVILAGIAVSVGLLFWAGAVQLAARRVMIEDLISRNETASSSTMIRGLRAWVFQYRNLTGADVEATGSLVQTIVSTVPARADAASAQLRQAAARLSKDFELRELLLQANKKTIRIEHYYTPDGTVMAPPALALAGLVDPLVQADKDLENLEASLAHLQPVSAEPALNAIVAARVAVHATTTPASLTDLADLVRDARRATSAALRSPDAAKMDADDLDLAATARFEPAATAETPTTSSPPSRYKAWASWIGYLVAILTLAVATIYVSNYQATPSFGTADDLRALFIASVGSAAAATIAAAIGFWKIAPTKE